MIHMYNLDSVQADATGWFFSSASPNFPAAPTAQHSCSLPLCNAGTGLQQLSQVEYRHAPPPPPPLASLPGSHSYSICRFLDRMLIG